MIILCGLGNPGSKYSGTRHNIGFECIDLLAKHLGVDGFNEKWDALHAIYEFSGEKYLLLKPQTFMNLSGKALSKFMNFYKVDPKDILVIYDDVDLALGEIRIRENGSAGTHNGMKSIIECIGTDQFPRLRLGIESRGSTAPKEMDLSTFVLSKFTPDENEKVNNMLDEAIKQIGNRLA